MNCTLYPEISGVKMKQDGVQVDEIILSSQVMEVCWTHALSSEKEVIKGTVLDPCLSNKGTVLDPCLSN